MKENDWNWGKTKEKKRDRVQRDSAGYQQHWNKKQTFQMNRKLDLETREFVFVLQLFLKRKKQDKEETQGKLTFS